MKVSLWNHTHVFDSSRNTHSKILLPAKFTQIFLSIQPRTESTRCSVRQMLCRMCQHWSAALFCMTSLPAFINPLVNSTKWQTSNRFSLNISCDSLIGYDFKTAEKMAQHFDKCFCLISIEIGADNSDQAIEPNFIVEIHRLAYILFSIKNIHVNAFYLASMKSETTPIHYYQHAKCPFHLYGRYFATLILYWRVSRSFYFRLIQ